MPLAAPTISSRAVAKLLATLAAEGVDAAACRDEAGIAAALIDDAEARVPLERLHDLWEVAARRLGRSDGALLVARQYALGDYALVGFVAMSAATVGEALAHVARYLRLWTDEPALELGEGGALRVVYRRRFADRPGVRSATEATLAEVIHGVRLGLGQALAPASVSFRHAAPPEARRYAEVFGAPVRFGQPVDEMRFAPAILATPLPRSDGKLGEFLLGLANEALARRGDDDSLRERLRALLAEELRAGVPDVDRVAKRLALGARTLRRRLADEGTSFREALDETRADLARGYVRDRRLPLCEVAFLLGFSEPSAFHRAFRRWTGRTPLAYRAEASD